MKERIVIFEPNKEVKTERHFINDNILYKTLSFVDMCERTDTEYKIEQVPETFEELKELCKKTGHYAVNILKDGLLNKEYIFIFGLSFRDNGDIEDIENNNVAENLTPARMYQIIKNLIGEE